MFNSAARFSTSKIHFSLMELSDKCLLFSKCFSERISACSTDLIRPEKSHQPEICFPKMYTKNKGNARTINPRSELMKYTKGIICSVQI